VSPGDKVDEQQKRYKLCRLYKFCKLYMLYKFYTIALIAHTRTRGSISARFAPALAFAFATAESGEWKAESTAAIPLGLRVCLSA
jgi:hypothetical protein